VSEQPRRRYLGLDVGGRRVGVAVSDELGLIASPLESLDLSKRGIERLLALVEQYNPQAIVIGLPTGLSGREGQQAAEVREFASTGRSSSGTSGSRRRLRSGRSSSPARAAPAGRSSWMRSPRL